MPKGLNVYVMNISIRIKLYSMCKRTLIVLVLFKDLFL